MLSYDISCSFRAHHAVRPVTDPDAWLRHQLGQLQHRRGDELAEVHLQTGRLPGRLTVVPSRHGGKTQPLVPSGHRGEARPQPAPRVAARSAVLYKYVWCFHSCYGSVRPRRCCGRHRADLFHRFNELYTNILSVYQWFVVEVQAIKLPNGFKGCYFTDFAYGRIRVVNMYYVCPNVSLGRWSRLRLFCPIGLYDSLAGIDPFQEPSLSVVYNTVIT